MDRTRSYFYANILSGVRTHERNILGNLSNAVSNLAVHPFAVAADAARSAATGKARTLSFDELPHQAAGAYLGLAKGFHEAIFALRNGVTKAQLSGALSAAEAGKLDIRRIEFKGGGANPFNWPGRALDGADQFFRGVTRNQELYGVAFQQAKSEGLSGRALTDRMAALTTGTDEAALKVQQQADAFAGRSVFQEQGGPLVKGLQVLAQSFPPFSFVVPFVKTPAAIFRQGAEASPLGFAMKAARNGGREGAQAVGRAAAGTLGLGYLAYLASTGRLSGSGPSNRAERQQLMEKGWRPDSIRVGDKWVNINTFQPISVPALAVANAFDAWREAGSDADTADRVAAGLSRSLRSALNASFLSGLADFVQAVEDSDGVIDTGAKYVGRLAGGFVPMSGALRSVTAATDPKVRQPRGAAETITASIPGLSQNVPARLDRFGQEIEREGGPLRRMADPFMTSTQKTDDPVLNLIDRLGLTVSSPTGRVNVEGFELTADQSRTVQQARGQLRKAALQRLIDNPKFGKLPEAGQRRLAASALSSASESVTNRAKRALKRPEPFTLEALMPSAARVR